MNTSEILIRNLNFRTYENKPEMNTWHRGGYSGWQLGRLSPQLGNMDLAVLSWRTGRAKKEKK